MNPFKALWSAAKPIPVTLEATRWQMLHSILNNPNLRTFEIGRWAYPKDGQLARHLYDDVQNALNQIEKRQVCRLSPGTEGTVYFRRLELVNVGLVVQFTNRNILPATHRDVEILKYSNDLEKKLEITLARSA
jgi:hypothetical protein